MRVALAVLLVAVLRPPVIHETFTPLPCPMHPQSTLETEGCLEQAILATDRKIDSKAKAIFVKLRPDARAEFVHGEREWLAYRRDNCAAEASKYVGGTLAPVIDASCQAARNRTHLADLTDLLKNLQSP